MSDKNENPYWSEEVHTEYHPPEGTFTEKAPQVVKTLLDGADGDPTLALHRLLFYMNRAGEKLHNGEELNEAKIKLEELIREKDEKEGKEL